MEGEYVNQELIHKPAQTVCADLTVDTKGSSSQVISGEHKCRMSFQARPIVIMQCIIVSFATAHV